MIENHFIFQILISHFGEVFKVKTKGWTLQPLFINKFSSKSECNYRVAKNIFKKMIKKNLYFKYGL